MFGSSISVRGLAAIAAACLLLCFAAASATAAPLVWVSSGLTDTISTYDSATGIEVGSPIHMPFSPGSIAITPNGRWAVVGNQVEPSVTVVDTATRKPVKTLALGGPARRVAISPDGQRAYIVAGREGEEGELVVLDPDDPERAVRLSSSSELWEVAADSTGAYIYLAVQAGRFLKTDTTASGLYGSAWVGGGVTSIALAPDGRTAYLTVDGLDEIKVIETAHTAVIATIPFPREPTSVAVSPDGKRLYVVSESSQGLWVVDSATDAIIGEPIAVQGGARQVAVTPDGKTAWVSGGGEITPVDLVTGTAEPRIWAPGSASLAVTPDQSPTASFSPPNRIVPGSPATFDGAVSTDPDGSIGSWQWSFGDGTTAVGESVAHAYKTEGIYKPQLKVVDAEGCGETLISTGHTAYCSGNLGSSVTHSVTVEEPENPPTAPIAGPVVPPSNNFRFGRIVHNRRNGTVRIQVTLPSAGFVLLFGKKVHAVTRKSMGVQTMWLTLHARVELAKELKKTLRAPVKFRVTFTPNDGIPKTVHRSVTLLRAPRHKH